MEATAGGFITEGLKEASDLICSHVNLWLFKNFYLEINYTCTKHMWIFMLLKVSTKQMNFSISWRKASSIQDPGNHLSQMSLRNEGK